MIKLDDGRTGLDQRHLAIAEKYIDRLHEPDGTMTKQWVLMQLALVALEGERLADQPAATETCDLPGSIIGEGSKRWQSEAKAPAPCPGGAMCWCELPASPRENPAPGATTIMFDGSEVMGTPVRAPRETPTLQTAAERRFKRDR